MKDELLKKLVRDFQEGNTEAGRELLALLYPVIDNYSYRYFGKASESCYYYVEDMLENFYDMMERYVPSETLFMTWFNKVIFRSYFSCEKYHLHHELWDPAIIEDVIIDGRCKIDDVDIDRLFSCLDGDEAKVMALRYPDFVDPKRIEQLFKDDKQEVREELFLELESKLQADRVKARDIYDKIVSIYYKKERIMKNRPSYLTSCETKMKTDRVAVLKKQRDKLMLKYREGISKMSYVRIAKYINRPVGSVSSLLQRGKDKMQKFVISQRVVGE